MLKTYQLWQWWASSPLPLLSLAWQQQAVCNYCHTWWRLAYYYYRMRCPDSEPAFVSSSSLNIHPSLIWSVWVCCLKKKNENRHFEKKSVFFLNNILKIQIQFCFCCLLIFPSFIIIFHAHMDQKNMPWQIFYGWMLFLSPTLNSFQLR